MFDRLKARSPLPLLLSDAVSPVPCLDIMAIHVKALVERIVAE